MLHWRWLPATKEVIIVATKQVRNVVIVADRGLFTVVPKNDGKLHFVFPASAITVTMCDELEERLYDQIFELVDEVDDSMAVEPDAEEEPDEGQTGRVPLTQRLPLGSKKGRGKKS